MVFGHDIASFLGTTLNNGDNPVHRPSDFKNCSSDSLVWVREYTAENLLLLEKSRPALAITNQELARQTSVSTVISDNPRLDFIRVLNQFFVSKPAPAIHPTAIIDPDTVIGNDITIGAFTRIGPKVTIEDDCVIGSGVSLEGEVYLSRKCHIKANSVIGAPGFGFEYDRDGTPLHFPHFGRIILEEDVWIGACSTIEQATLGETRLCRGSKVDDLVQIGHNSTVGANTLIMANTVLCGGVIIGERCWIAPNSVIKQKVKIGNNVTIGLGSVVIRDVANELVVAGVPAKPLAPKL